MSQQDLFPNLENEWRKEWKDMPEFNSKNKKPYQQIIISFRNFDDVKLFADKLGIKSITPKTKGFWFPEKDLDDKDIYVNKNWKGNEK